jgi:PAS domain S-box-containing protein
MADIVHALLIEDFPAEARLFHEHLREAAGGDRFDICHAPKLEKGLTHLAEHATEIVFLDLGLPDSQGLETYEAVRRAQPRLPVIILSGTRDEELAVRAVKTGAQDYLFKGEATGDLIVRAARYAMARAMTENALRDSEAALHESELRYRRLFESARDGILILDAETGRIIDVNPYLIGMLGFSHEQFTGKNVWELGAFKDIVANRDKFLELRRNEYVRYEDLALETANGQNIVVEFVSNVYDEDRRKVIQCNIRNITARKREEANLRRMATVVRDSNDAITIQNFEGGITAWNRGAELMYGYSEEEAFQSNIDRLTTPNKVLEQKAFIQRLVAGEDVTSFETQRVTKDGRVLNVWMTVTKLVDDTGRPVGIASTERDITARKQAEIEIKNLNAGLERRVAERTAELLAANLELEAFAYSVSHDLRAPLRAIDGFTGILIEDNAAALNEEGKRACAVIRDNAQRMGRLIDNLLAFSRLGTAPLDPVRIDMKKAAESVMAEAFETASPSARRRVDFKIGALRSAHGDPAMIRQVWANLIANALKFSSRCERAVISITGEEKEGESVYCVRDNGAGFDMRYENKLFGVFQRLHDRKEFEGTGVGLAIVKRIVDRHGGRVWASGAPDKGAAFYFSLPRNGAAGGGGKHD